MADSSSDPKRSTHMNSSARSTASSSNPKRSTHMNSLARSTSVRISEESSSNPRRSSSPNRMNSSAKTSVSMSGESSSNPRMMSSENFNTSGGMNNIEEYNADVETKDDLRYKKSADYVSGRDPHDCAIKSSWNLNNSGEQTNLETEDVMKKNTSVLMTPTIICCNHCVHVPGRDLGGYPSQAALACKLCGWVFDNFILSSEVTYVNGSGSAGGVHRDNDPTMDLSGQPMMVWCDRCSYVPARDSSDRALACKVCGLVLHNYILSPEVIYVDNATARKMEKAARDTDQTTSETNDVDKLDNAARKMMQSQTLLINLSPSWGSDHRIMSMNQQQQVVNMAQSNPSTSGDQTTSETNDVVDNAARKVSISSLPVDMLMEIFDRVPPSENCYRFCREWRRYYRFRQRSLTILNPPFRFFPLSRRYFYGLVSLTLDFSLVDFPEANATTSTAGEIIVQLVTDHDLTTIADDLPTLQRLELLGCDIVTASGLTHFAQECQSLLYLHLRDCHHVDDDAVLAVARASASLEHMEIAFCEVTAAGIATLRTLTTRVSVRGCPRSEALRRFPHPI